MAAPGKRPTAEELLAADGVAIDDLVRPGLRLLLVGINPGRHSGATGFHFGNPQNLLWRALHQSGLTPRLLHPNETDELLALGIGITTSSTARRRDRTTFERATTAPARSSCAPRSNRFGRAR